MTGRELLEAAGQHPGALVALGLLPPAIVLLLGFLHGQGRGSFAPWRYVYAVLVYASCVPGVGAAILTGYTLFFTHENLLDKNLLVYVLPVVSMVVTLVLIRKNVSFDDVPGFDRLSGLMIVIGVTFTLLLAIRKTFIGIFFGASLLTLVAIGAFLIALLQWGTHALFRGRGEPRRNAPRFPGD